MSMTRFPGFILLILLTISATLQAQGPKKKEGHTTSTIHPNVDIIPGIVVVKLKPEFRHFSNDLKALQNHPFLSESIKKFDVRKFEKMLPTSKAPANAI